MKYTGPVAEPAEESSVEVEPLEGAPAKPAADPLVKAVVCFIAALAILWPAYSVYKFNNPRRAQPSKASVVKQARQPSDTVADDTTRRITSDGVFGCTNREYHDELVGYAAHKDMEAFKQGLTVGLVSGECVKFEVREEVFVTDTKIFSGLVEIRRKGSMRKYWTNIEAIQ